MIRRLLTLLATAVALALLVPAAAGAHASLTGSTPASGAVLDAAPTQIVFEFSERVEGSFGALRVIDDRGRRVDDGDVSRPAGRSDALAVGVRPGTGNGAYAATYRVISADGHPVSGGATFVVGRNVSAAPPDVRELTAEEAAPAGIATALSVARVVRYLGIGGAVGLLALVLLVWAPLRRRGAVPSAADEAFSRAAGRWLRIVAVVGVVGSLAALVLQAANVGGTGVGDALRPDTLRDVVGTGTGAWFLATAVAFLVLAVLAGRAVRTPAGIRGRAGAPALVAVLIAALLIVAPALGGHALAASPAWALVPIQILHVAGMGVWIGGLAGLLLVLPRATKALPAGRERLALLAATLLRFSPLALVSVAVLTAAGTGLALLHLTTLYDLTDTAYGRAILVKVVLLVFAIGVAVAQREYLLPRLRRLAAGEAPAGQADAAAEVPAAEQPVAVGVGGDAEAGGLPPSGASGAPPAAGGGPGPSDEDEDEDDDVPAPPSPATGRHVRLALRAEVLLLVGVLGATGALAGYAPPKSLDAGPVSVTRDVGEEQLQLTVDPARPGANAMHLYAFGKDGQPLRGAKDLKVRAVPPGKAGGSDVPVDVPFVVSGPGHWTAAAVPLGTRGGWKVEVVVRISAFDQLETTFPVRVR